MPTLAQAIKYTAFAGKAITPENVNRYLDAGKKITQEQLDAHHAAPVKCVDQVEQVARPVEYVEPVEEVADVAPTTTVADAQAALVQSQVRLRTALDRQREYRGHFGVALARWQQVIGMVVTPEQNARQYIASSIAQRQGEKDGTAPPRRRSRAMRSIIDATAAAYNSGNGRNGGGNSFRRVVRDDSGNWVRPRSIHDVAR